MMNALEKETNWCAVPEMADIASQLLQADIWGGQYSSPINWWLFVFKPLMKALMVGWNPLIGDKLIQWINDSFPARRISLVLHNLIADMEKNEKRKTTTTTTTAYHCAGLCSTWESEAPQSQAEKMVRTWNTELGQLGRLFKKYLQDPKGQLPDGNVLYAYTILFTQDDLSYLGLRVQGLRVTSTLALLPGWLGIVFHRHWSLSEA